jgi:hypothetical protein
VREVDVTLTDYALALELGVLAVLLCRRSVADVVLRRRFGLFFAGSALAALTGGTVHGFMPDSSILWVVSLVSLGVPAMAAWGISLRILAPRPWKAWLWRAAVAEFFVYSLVVVAGARSFAVAIANYLPAAVALAVAFARAWRATGRATAFWGLVGMVLIFLGAGVQAGRLSLHPRYFDHNALYHVIDGVAVVLIFVAARGLVATCRER